MILDAHLPDIRRRLDNDNLKGPPYEGYCFAQVPHLVKQLFHMTDDEHPFASEVVRGLKSHDRHVVLLLIDGFGYEQWIRYGEDHGPMWDMLERGVVMPLSAVFPSTTSASLTTLHSGLTPQEHGLIEFTMYLDSLKRMIQTLPFMPYPRGLYAGELLTEGVPETVLFDGVSLFRQMEKAGIPGYAFMKHNEAFSAYSRVAMDGAVIVPYYHASDMMASLRNALLAAKTPSYFYVYWAGIDELSHYFGPHSPQAIAEMRSFMEALRREVLQEIPLQLAEKTTLIMTADHGHIDTPRELMTRIDDIPGLESLLERDAHGTVITGGSSRDLFLQAKTGKVDEVIGLLQRKLCGKAAVLRSQELADDGLFGRGAEHRCFRSRIGNVLILPRGKETVTYRHCGIVPRTKLGMHGGMSHEEMLTVLAVAGMEELLV